MWIRSFNFHALLQSTFKTLNPPRLSQVDDYPPVCINRSDPYCFQIYATGPNPNVNSNNNANGAGSKPKSTSQNDKPKASSSSGPRANASSASAASAAEEPSDNSPPQDIKCTKLTSLGQLEKLRHSLVCLAFFESRQLKAYASLINAAMAQFVHDPIEWLWIEKEKEQVFSQFFEKQLIEVMPGVSFSPLILVANWKNGRVAGFPPSAGSRLTSSQFHAWLNKILIGEIKFITSDRKQWPELTKAQNGEPKNSSDTEKPCDLNESAPSDSSTEQSSTLDQSGEQKEDNSASGESSEENGEESSNSDESNEPKGEESDSDSDSDSDESGEDSSDSD